MISILAAFFISMPTYAAQEVGKGGNVISCAKGENVYEGLYSLDYLLTDGTLDPRETTAWESSLDEIAQLLKVKVPELYLSFQTFRNDVFNESYAHKHVWEKAPYGLNPIDDQAIAVTLPSNCLVQGKINLIQAVVRLNPGYSGAETQVFKYMPSVFADLQKGRALQASFLFVHEWLWELSKNVERNRRIDRYLHSKTFASHSSADAIRELRGMGLSLSGDAYAFDTVQAAVDQAQPGATVWLLDKTYTEVVKIEKPVNLKGSPHSELVGGFDVQSNDVTIEGISFRPKTDWAIKIAYAQNVRINRNSFSSEGIGGDAVFGLGNSQIFVTENHFEHLLHGITLMGTANAVITKNEFLDLTDGIDISDSASATIENNVFTGIKGIGLTLDSNDGSQTPSRISKNHLTRGFYGAFIKNKGKASFSSNSLAELENGLLIMNDAEVAASQNEFIRNKTALFISSSGPLKVERNTFKENTLAISNVSHRSLGTTNMLSGNGKDEE